MNKAVITFLIFLLAMPYLQGETENRNSTGRIRTVTAAETSDIIERSLLRPVSLEYENKDNIELKVQDQRKQELPLKVKEEGDAANLGLYLKTERTKLLNLEKKLKKMEGLTQESSTAAYFQNAPVPKEQLLPNTRQNFFSERNESLIESEIHKKMTHVQNRESIDKNNGTSTVHIKETKDNKEIAFEIASSLESRLVETGDDYGPLLVAETYYQLKSFEKALDIYQKIQPDTVPEEQEIWIHYQIANCYRNLKKFDLARKAYEDFMHSFSDSYFAEQAKWFVNHIDWWEAWYKKNKSSDNRFSSITNNFKPNY